jgi:tetratricopeptide (TPR) repeat protein
MLALIVLLLAQTAATTPTDAQGWFRLGIERHDAADYANAVAALEKARELKLPNPVQLPLRLARAYARTGQNEKAIAALQEALANGFGRADQLTGENDFLPIRTDARWPELVATARKNQHPCRNAPEFRQLDYWLGEWDVETQGQKIAQSSIQLSLDDCVVFENYATVDGAYAGKSFSLWNATAKQWEQQYADTTGNWSHWAGGFTAGTMVFTSEKPSYTQRMSYIKEGPDKVRQHIEISTDGGKTWSTGYDGLYVRRK